MGQEQLYAFFSTTFNSFHWQVNIVLTKNGNITLIDVVIVDPMQVDLLPQSYTTQIFTTFNAVQAKERNYHN